MYTFKEYLPLFVGDDLPEKGWDSGMYCLETDRAKILRSNLLRGFVGCFHSDHIYKGEVLRMLYSIFLLDLQNAQQRAIVHRQTPQRVEEIFIGFIRLLPRHFADTPSFSKFFSRLSGMSPKEYRMGV